MLFRSLYHFFPVVIDNTQIAEFKVCPISWWYKYILHLQQESRVHLHFGGAYAKGHEVGRTSFFRGKVDSYAAIAFGVEAIEAAWGDSTLFMLDRKNLEACTALLEAYYERYPLEMEEYKPLALQGVDSETAKQGVELSMSAKIGAHPTLPLPLYYSGRADMLVHSPNYSSDSVLVFDDKTTGSYISANFLSSWAMRSQFTGYVYLCRQLGLKAVGAVVSIA